MLPFILGYFIFSNNNSKFPKVAQLAIIAHLVVLVFVNFEYET
jgi:hypothetical protein